jgi:hypothetical protein
MIYYLVTKKHSYTVKGWLEQYSKLWEGRMKILPYEDFSDSFDKGTFIFSDLERLKPSITRKVENRWNELRKAGCNTLNHPVQSLRRYALQKTISNDFRVFRTNEIPDDIRFPVFLRRENDHAGNITPLLKDHKEVRKARLRNFYSFKNLRMFRFSHFQPLLLAEFINTMSPDGIFRKYSAMKIGDQIIPRHILFSKSWCVKTTDIVSSETLKEEYAYFASNPHESELSKIFDIAKIDYGRIDYGFYQGRLQVWEINTNPLMISSSFAKHRERQKFHLLVGEDINKALEKIDSLPADTVKA